MGRVEREGVAPMVGDLLVQFRIERDEKLNKAFVRFTPRWGLRGIFGDRRIADVVIACRRLLLVRDAAARA